MSMVKRFFPLFIVFFVVVLLLAAAAGGYFHHWLNRPLVIDDQVVVIDRGQTFTSIAGELVEQGIISHPQLFRFYGRLTGMDTELRVGEYLIPAGMTVPDLVEHLSSGSVIQHIITLIEGRTLADNLQNWSNSRLKITDQQYLTAEVKDLLQLEVSSPEGLFFSDTYYYAAGAADLDILRRAHIRLMDVLSEEWQSRKPGLPYKTPYEALVMASVIERETGIPAERPIIAGVFVRRLQQGMKLQSDPTVIYGMGDSYDGRIRSSDLKADTPYNTYRIKGLPPTPIASVGREAIHAALNPAEGSALYFVAVGDGTHVFNSTLAGHNRDVRKYQLNRRKDYRSTLTEPDAQDAAVANREQE